MTWNLNDILAGLGQVAGNLQAAGVGGQKDQKHIAAVSGILALIGFVLNYHPSSPVASTVQAADGAFVAPGTTVTPV